MQNLVFSYRKCVESLIKPLKSTQDKPSNWGLSTSPHLDSSMSSCLEKCKETQKTEGLQKYKTHEVQPTYMHATMTSAVIYLVRNKSAFLWHMLAHGTRWWSMHRICQFLSIKCNVYNLAWGMLARAGNQRIEHRTLTGSICALVAQVFRVESLNSPLVMLSKICSSSNNQHVFHACIHLSWGLLLRL